MENKIIIELKQHQSIWFKRIKSNTDGSICNLNKEPITIELNKYVGNYLMVVNYNGLLIQVWIGEVIVFDKDHNEIYKFSNLQ